MSFEEEIGVVCLKEDGKSEERLESGIRCLPQYESSSFESFGYWKIRDYAYSYRSRITTPSVVAEYVISAIQEFRKKPLLVSFNAEDIRNQAAVSTKEGKPLSVLDGIFMAIKDDIDCYPHPSTGMVYPTFQLSIVCSFIGLINV